MAMAEMARELQGGLPAVRDWLARFAVLSGNISAHNAAEELFLDPALREASSALDVKTLAETAMYAQLQPATLVLRKRPASPDSLLLLPSPPKPSNSLLNPKQPRLDELHVPLLFKRHH
jgi:hypothetical protein